jgi:hypothetical protein
MRPLIVHYHLFKNAGTSVEAILRANFEDAWVSFDSEDPAGFVSTDSVLDMARADPRIVAFSSHQVRPPAPVARDFTITPVVFLRHPLDRMQSVYDFDRRRGPTTPAGEVAATHEFGEYIDVMLERNAHHVCNFQVRSLTDLRDPSTGKRTANDRDDYERAVRFVTSLPAVGIVERYRESWFGLAAVIRCTHPRFFVPHIHSNSDPNRLDSLDERLDRMHSRLGDARFERLREANRLDLDLYDIAVARLDLREPSGG